MTDRTSVPFCFHGEKSTIHKTKGKQMIRLAACLIVILVWCDSQVFGQGSYADVTAEDVVALKLNHYFTSDKKSREADFLWAFTRDDFVIKKGKGAIPVELSAKLLQKGEATDEIKGKWRVKQGKLILSAIPQREGSPKQEVALNIYRTAPTVIRIGEPQYVFEVTPSTPSRN